MNNESSWSHNGLRQDGFYNEIKFILRSRRNTQARRDISRWFIGSTYWTTEWNCSRDKYYQPGLGTWPLCGQIVKVWPFSEVVWQQIFCVAFWSIEVVLKLWPNLHQNPEFVHSKCVCALSQARFPSWQLKLPCLTSKPWE